MISDVIVPIKEKSHWTNNILIKYVKTIFSVTMKKPISLKQMHSTDVP